MGWKIGNDECRCCVIDRGDWDEDIDYSNLKYRCINNRNHTGKCVEKDCPVKEE